MARRAASSYPAGAAASAITQLRYHAIEGGPPHDDDPSVGRGRRGVRRTGSAQAGRVHLGWIDLPDLPSGSTIVEIDLEQDGDGTLIRLTHRDMPADHADMHRVGWEHYLRRLAVCAAGGDPGPDPGADG
ncbi:MAG: SRPBCC domain-containing protein [Actinobacteria bacterium]|nr:SRPBCC domain-containing protein [Actinomycetota bacterium]